jgi:hypothetical protein
MLIILKYIKFILQFVARYFLIDLTKNSLQKNTFCVGILNRPDILIVAIEKFVG